jgi:hypothetical protein
MELLSITEVSVLYNKPRNTVASAVQRKWLKSTKNQHKEHFIHKGDAEFYFNGPPPLSLLVEFSTNRGNWYIHYHSLYDERPV